MCCTCKGQCSVKLSLPIISYVYRKRAYQSRYLVVVKSLKATALVSNYK